MKKFYCNNCKTEVTEKDTYCPNCGYIFDDEEDYDDEELEEIQESKNSSHNNLKSSVNSLNQNKPINNVPVYNNYPSYSQNPINKKGDMIKTYEWFINYGTIVGIMLGLIGLILGLLLFVSDADTFIIAIIVWLIFTGWGIIFEKNCKWKAYMLKLLYEIRNEKN